MKNKINIAVVGLGQIGNYLMNELISKKKDIELKLEKKLIWSLYQQKILIRKENLKLIEKFFLEIH